MVDIGTYTGLITRQHASKPKFVATVAASCQPFVDALNFAMPTLGLAFDLDTAVGVQLDAVGVRVGRNRFVTVPISGSYFSWDTPNLGWDQGAWRGQFDATTGITALDDTTYRDLLRAKIILNKSNGTIATMEAAILQLFSRFHGTVVSIKDNQDMTMVVSISGVIPPAVYLALLDSYELVIAPSGVGVTFTITSINTTALFGWDTESSTIQGWDQGSWAGVIGVGPGQVTGLSVVSHTASQVVLSWLPPLQGTGTLSYQAEFRISRSNAPFELIGAPTGNTTITLTGFTAGQTYDFQVYATNNTGAGPASPYVTITMTATGPGAVQGLTASNATSSSIDLTWTAITGASYTVQYRVSGTNAWTNQTATAPSATLSNLLSATLYDIQVYAATTAGQGPPSAIVTTGTTGALPGAPTNLTVTSANVSDIVVTFSPPTTGAATGLTYALLYGVAGTSPTYQTFTGTATTNADGTVTMDLTGLQPSTAYSIEAYASNAGGRGPATAPVTGTTQKAPIGQVTGLTVVSATAANVTLSWTAVAGATSYQVLYQQTGWTWWVNGPLVNAPTTQATVQMPTGSQGVTYDFEVYAQ